jgi:hypothetical protein
MSDTISRINVNDTEYGIISENAVNPNLLLNTNWGSYDNKKYYHWNYLDENGNSYNMPTGWGFTKSFMIYRPFKHNLKGLYRLEIYDSSFYICQSVELKKDTYYTLSLMADDVFLKIRKNNGDSSTGIFYQSDTIMVNGESKRTLNGLSLDGWTVVTFKSNANTSVVVDFMFKGNDGGTTEMHYLKLEEGTIATAYVQNEVDLLSQYNIDDKFDSNVFKKNDAGDTITGNTMTIKEDAYIEREIEENGSKEVVYTPLIHPDLNTQPTVQTYMFMGNYVYEQLIPESLLKKYVQSCYAFDATYLFDEIGQDNFIDDMVLLDGVLIFDNRVVRTNVLKVPFDNEIVFEKEVDSGSRLLYAKIVYTTMNGAQNGECGECAGV